MRTPTAVGAQFRFSAGALAQRERLPVWNQVLAGTLGPLAVEPIGADPFHAQATICRAPRLGAIRAATSAIHLRGARGSTAHDRLLFVAAPASAWTASAGGRRVELNPGDGILLGTGAAWSVSLPADATFTALRLPQAALPLRLSDRHAAGPWPIAGSSVALRLLVSYLASALATEALLAPALGALAVAHIHHLVTAALGTTRTSAVPDGLGIPAGRLLAIKAEIALRRDNADLTIDAIAAAQGVTPRYVQMLFEQEGGTFSEYLLGQRLERAHQLLTGPHVTARPIGAIAFEVGFNDLSYFNRTFRRRFGATPSEVRGRQVPHAHLPSDRGTPDAPSLLV